ncbi:MAG: fibronectin type III domain-containing protein [Acidimicrobiales bacterium]
MAAAALLAAAIAAQVTVPSSPAQAQATTGSMQVEPYYVVPADLTVHPEYQVAIDRYMAELRSWYGQRVGRTFTLAPLRTVRGPDYATMRCGAQADPSCLSDRDAIPNWWNAMHAIVPSSPFSVKLIFGQGGGGFAGGILTDRLSGFAVVGDWVLEPISGLRDPAAIHCGFADWQCEGGTPKGTVAHELGHAFGLHHPPDFEPGPLLMRWHGDYPRTGFRPYELAILRNNPMFDPTRWSGGPWLSYDAPDEVAEGTEVTLTGENLTLAEIYFVHGTGEVRLAGSPMASTVSVTVPAGLGSGMFQARWGSSHGNGVPVNVYPSSKVPSAPENVVATAVNPATIRVTWTDTSSNESGFRVTDGESEWTVPADATEFVMHGLRPGTQKCFSIQSYITSGRSSDWVPKGGACVATRSPGPPDRGTV